MKTAKREWRDTDVGCTSFTETGLTVEGLLAGDYRITGKLNDRKEFSTAFNVVGKDSSCRKCVQVPTQLNSELEILEYCTDMDLFHFAKIYCANVHLSVVCMDTLVERILSDQKE